MAVAVLSMLVVRGDGRPTPEPLFVPWSTPLAGLHGFPTPASFRLWAALWGDGWGEVRANLTRPASERLATAYAEVLQRAVPWGFSFREPVLYETESYVPLFIPDPPATFYARYFVGPNRILVDSMSTAMMTDEELQVLLSHELGHAIDAQSERIGHWSFKDVYWMDEQQFADHIARLLNDNARVKAFNEKFVHPGRRTR